MSEAAAKGACGVQGEATGRAIKLARFTKTPLYVVHVMSKDAAEEIVKGRATGQKVWGEVVAGAIGLTDEKWSVPLISSLSCLLFHRAPRYRAEMHKRP